MPSPFPGMDPYLEQPDVWPDFHGTFLMGLRAELNRLLPMHYAARWDRYVWIDQGPGETPTLLGKPDVFLPSTVDRPAASVAAMSLAAPATVTLPAVQPAGKPYLKIVDMRGHRVVTVVELLSPANKTPGRDRDAYLAKREEYLRARVNLVEMDLLRGGLRPPLEQPVSPADYFLLVCRAEDYPRAGIWPLTIRDALPALPVPLHGEDGSVALPLRPSLDRAYDEGRLSEDIDYTQPPTPPLTAADAAWAREQVARSGV